MNFSLVYCAPCWQNSVEKEIEILLRDVRATQKQPRSDVAKAILKYIFPFFSWKAIYLSPESLERVICYEYNCM